MDGMDKRGGQDDRMGWAKTGKGSGGWEYIL